MSSKILDTLASLGHSGVVPEKPVISVGLGTCGIGNGAMDLHEALQKASADSDIVIKRTGCFGFCAEEPLIMIYTPRNPVLLFTGASVRLAEKYVNAATNPAALEKLSHKARGKISRWNFRTGNVMFGTGFTNVPEWNEIPFFMGQEKLVLRDCGLIDPENIAEYVAIGGYSALNRAVTSLKPDDVIDIVSQANLRGRGGAGFPTASKWKMMRQNKGERKYIICNADEGDPGAYMNRNVIESDPHMLIEGMIIGAYAMGADSGFIYVRAEYPLAVQRLEKALGDARSKGLLGKNILGSSFSFDLEIVRGAGAFVCGEETALIASAQGLAGRPLPRPPFPAEKGYKGYPSNINNVETWSNVPVIIAAGPEAFTSIGTVKSPGTKIFSLVGKVKNTGLVELPLGTPLNQIVFSMGEGAGPLKKIRAVQTGGPSGGCIPVTDFGTPVDYESLNILGAIMGSGGMVVMDQDNCMVDVARYFVSFTSAESCGKCAPCREGLSQMLRILTDITEGRATRRDLEDLERIAYTVRDSALCGLGQTAANPVLTTLKYFRDEYLLHIDEKRCGAGVCEGLFQALCENSCPLHMNIPGYLALLQEGRIEDAFDLTLRDNPLPGTMGRICHFHCQMRCRRDSLDESVAQGEIHRYLADTMYKMGREKDVWNTLIKEKKPATGRKIAIVGAGPAGLSAAFYLIRLGHDVVVIESLGKAGGILRYGIPSYRLPKDVLDKELSLFRKLGVKFMFNTCVGVDVPMKDLTSQYDAVLVAIGAHGERSLGIPGENLVGVHRGYEWLERYARGKNRKPGRRALVIGGGNVAIDVARTLYRLDCDVTVAYRRSRKDLPANSVELEGAEQEGIRLEYMLAPEEIIAGNNTVSAVRFRVMKSGGIDQSGRPRPVPSERTVEIPCDDVFVAVGETVDSSCFAKEGLPVLPDGRFNTTGFSGELKDTIWAIGDAVSGPATAAEAMGMGKQTARALDRMLMKRDVFSTLFPDVAYIQEIPAETGKSTMNHSRCVPPEQRRGNFQEISLGYSGEQALQEASRCLRCDVRNNARSPWR